MTPLYKHLRKQDLQTVLSGSLKLSRLSTLRVAELGPLSDPLEGTFDIRCPYPAFIQGGTPEFHRFAKNVEGIIGFEDGWNGCFTMNDASFLGAIKADPWVLCLTTRIEPLGNYDATVIVDDVWKLALQLSAAHPEILGTPRVSPVMYVGRVSGVFDDPALIPFRKEPRFADEKEVRIVWPAMNAQESPFCTKVSDICLSTHTA